MPSSSIVSSTSLFELEHRNIAAAQANTAQQAKLLHNQASLCPTAGIAMVKIGCAGINGAASGGAALEHPSRPAGQQQ